MKKEWKNYGKELFVLAAPIIVENTLQTLLGTTDTYFAGKLADEAIAGIGVTNLIMNLFISLFTAVSVGTNVIVARNYGKRDFKQISRTIFHSLVLGGSIGILTGAVCVIFGRQILGISGADDGVIACAMPYYLAVAAPCVVLCLQLMLSGCLRAVKDTKTPMYVTGASNLLNIFLNLLFIKMGLGVLGLGLATTFSRTIGAYFLFKRLYHHDEKVKIVPCKPSRGEFRGILEIGVPAGMEKLIMRIGQLVYNSMILSIGTAAYVAHNVGGTIENYSYIPAVGIGLAVSTMVGVSLGENNVPKAKQVTAAAFLFSIGFMIFFGISFFVFAPQLATLFTETREVQEMIAAVLRVIAFFQPFTYLVQIMTNALQGAGDTGFPMYTTFLGIWGIRIGVGYLLAVCLQFGLVGVWWAYAADVTVRGLLLLARFQRGKWQKIKI